MDCTGGFLKSWKKTTEMSSGDSIIDETCEYLVSFDSTVGFDMGTWDSPIAPIVYLLFYWAAFSLKAWEKILFGISNKVKACKWLDRSNHLLTKSQCKLSEVNKNFFANINQKNFTGHSFLSFYVNWKFFQWLVWNALSRLRLFRTSLDRELFRGMDF